MVFLQFLVIGLFFLLELAGLAAFSYWGFHFNGSSLLKVILGIGTPILVAVFWGMFVAPKANFPVTTLVRIILQIIIFGLAALALRFSGKPELALLFTGIAVIEMILMYAWVGEEE